MLSQDIKTEAKLAPGRGKQLPTKPGSATRRQKLSKNNPTLALCPCQQACEIGERLGLIWIFPDALLIKRDDRATI
jgi:hypothetical protein